MKIKFLKKLLLVTPVVVLLVTLLFLNYEVQFFKDTASSFVYSTNVESVQRFGRELADLAEQGYPSEVYSDLYTRKIKTYSKTLGEKEAIISFWVDEAGEIGHSTEHNKAFLAPLLQNEANMALITSAFESRGSGEIALESEDGVLIMYYHRFHSGPDEYSLFMCVEKEVVEAQVHVYGFVIPIGAIGLILFFVIELGIYHMMQDIMRDGEEKREQEEG